MDDTALTLGADFATASRDEWVALAEKALRGRPVETLRTSMLDGVVVEPLYTATDVPEVDTGLPGSVPFVRGGRAAGAVLDGWDRRQHFADADPVAQNAAVLAALEAGVTSVWLRVDDPGDLDRALEGVLLDLAPIVLDAGHRTADAALHLVERWRQVGSTADIGGGFGADPIGLLARTGMLEGDLDAHFDELVELIALAEEFGAVRALAVDATVVADAAATTTDELAHSIAVGVAYLRALTGRGLTVDQIARQIEFTYSVDADQFTSIAKLRAARRLWARVVEASGGSSEGARQQQHAVSATSMLSRVDPWVNLLRVTVATFAAGIGGADSVTAAPFDGVVGVSDELGQRMARNTQALLIEESNLSRMIDPAGGSWYVESLTDQLARTAWSRFQEIEAAGGVVAELRSGALAERLQQTWHQRLGRLGSRKDPLTGVSEFPNLDEHPLTRTPHAARPSPDIVVERVQPLPRHRLAAPFEALREQAAASAPSVFCANLGPLAVHTARTTWATNFFAVGGIAAEADASFADAAEAATAFAASDARLAVICSSDDVYAEQAAATASALRDGGAARVYLAGNPGDRRAELEAAGVDEFVHVGVDVLDILQRAHTVLAGDNA